MGGEECLFDRLLRVCDEKRRPSAERKAQNLALKRDQNDDDADDMSRLPTPFKSTRQRSANAV
jgi:hypothetical protein